MMLNILSSFTNAVQEYAPIALLGSALGNFGPLPQHPVVPTVDLDDIRTRMAIKPASDNISPDFTESEADAFIREQNLEPWMQVVSQLIARHFIVPCGVTMLKKHDPEFPDEWLSLRVDVAGDVESVMNAYDQFTRQFSESVPANVSPKIRLSLGIA